MATSLTKGRLSGILICALCSKRKSGRNLKLLQCFHSFCHSCLVSQRQKQNDKSELICPVCNSATKLLGTGLDGLKDEMKITALEDLMKRFCNRLVCQGCLPKGSQSVALVKCITCDRHLCEACYEFHSGSDLFEGHDVATELCELHGNIVTNICITCCVGLCVDCIFSRIHEDHETAKLGEGLIKVESQVEEDRKYLQSLYKRKKPKRKRKQILKNRHLTSMLNMHCQEEQNNSEKNVKGIPSPAQLRKIIGETEKYKIGRITKLSHRKIELRRNIILMKENLLKVACKQSCKLIDRSVFLSGRESHVISTELCDKVWEKRSKQIFGLEILEDFSAMVASGDFDDVVRYNTDGEVVDFYPAKGSKQNNKVQLMTVHDGKLHILCKDNKTLETIDIDSLQREIHIIVNLPEDLCSMAYHPNNKSFLFSQHPNEISSKVYTYLEDDIEVDECSLPAGFLRVFQHAGSIKTAVARLDKGNVKVYDSECSLLYNIPYAGLEEHFSEPSDVAPLDQTSILLADRERCHISQFTNNEAAIFDASLSREGGLSAPWYIACKYPYLWVACFTKLCLFKWQ